LIRDRHSLDSDKLGYGHVNCEGLNQPFGENCRQLWKGRQERARGGQSCTKAVYLWTAVTAESRAVKEKNQPKPTKKPTE